MKKDISKTIFFRWFNKFTKQEVFTTKMPYVPFWAINGYYSQYYKRVVNNISGFEKGLLACKHWFETDKKDRIVLSWPNGFSLDMPYDVNDKDLKIIEHYLEGIKMSLSK